MSLRFPAIFDHDGVLYVITFPDVPSAITQARTMEEAYDRAADALGSALEGHVEHGEAIPTPSPAQAGQHLIQVPAWAEELIGQVTSPKA
jgi:antitoxin HicB